jgi:indolepyruvate ferredoxin oxidoreductase
MEATVLDFTGLAQKNGAVVSQVRIAPAGQPLHAVRIGAGTIDLMIATDTLVAAAPDGLRKLAEGKSALVLNIDETPTADAVTDRDATLPTDAMIERLVGLAGPQAFQLRASSLAQGLFGDAVAANVMMLGYAWQQGLLPLTLDAIEGAIRANGAAVEMNLRAIAWGRFAATDLAEAERIAGLAILASDQPEPLDRLIGRRIDDLTAYQDRDYARRYSALVDRALAASRPFGIAGERLVEAIAVNGYKLMAYKDEYEVARLYAEPAFREGLAGTFSDTRSLSVWLAPPILSRIDPKTGRPAKRKFGPWVFKAFAVLARLKGLRGTWADPFGRTAERRAERRLIEEYFADIEEAVADLSLATIDAATRLAELPADIRGYGPVKERAIERAEVDRLALKDVLAAARNTRVKAAA